MNQKLREHEELINFINLARKGGNVSRFHTHQMIQRQNVAQHSFNCAILAYEIACKYNQSVRRSEGKNQIDPDRCLRHMLIHDIHEQVIGDIPSNFKNYHLNDIVKNLEDRWNSQNVPFDWFFRHLGATELTICHFVDKFECLLTANEELRSGNFNMEEIVENNTKVCQSLVNSCANAELKEILTMIMKEYHFWESENEF